MVSTAPALPGRTGNSMPSISRTTNVTISPTRNSSSRMERQLTWRSRIRDSSDAVTNMRPPPATATAGPSVWPRASDSSDTTSALVKAVSAADARMR